jgi:hypothetical protein
MQCSCCGNQSESLREISLSALDARQRKTIVTFHLCAICRLVYLVNPLRVASRSGVNRPAAPLQQRA